MSKKRYWVGSKLTTAEAHALYRSATKASLATIDYWPEEIDQGEVGDRLYEVCASFHWQSQVNRGPTERTILSQRAKHLDRALELLRAELDGCGVPLATRRDCSPDPATVLLVLDDMDDMGDIDIDLWLAQCRQAVPVLERLRRHQDDLSTRLVPEKGPGGRRNPKLAFGEFCYRAARVYAKIVGVPPDDVAVSVGMTEQTATRFIHAAAEVLLSRSVEPTAIKTAYDTTSKWWSGQR